jgi:hypothetical protein
LKRRGSGCTRRRKGDSSRAVWVAFGCVAVTPTLLCHYVVSAWCLGVVAAAHTVYMHHTVVVWQGVGV